MTPTPATLDESVNYQDSRLTMLNLIHSSVDSNLIKTYVENGYYVVVYSTKFKNTPLGISILFTKNSNTYFVNVLKSDNIKKKLLTENNNIGIDGTKVNKVTLKEIDNPMIKNHFSNLGLNSNQSIFKRETKLRQFSHAETLTVIEYMIDQPSAN